MKKIQVIEIKEMRIPEDFLIIEVKDKKYFLEEVNGIFRLGYSYYTREINERIIYIFRGEITEQDLIIKRKK